MQPAGNSAFTTTFLNEAPLPIQQEGKDVVLNFTLTIPEAMFLAFIKKIIQANLDQGNNLIYLGTTEPMQRGFNDWVVKTFPTSSFTAEELKLVTLISSVWTKTKTHVENELKTGKNQEAIDIEQQWQQAADSTAEQFLSQGRTGKVFTERQANFLLTASNNIGSSPK